MLIMINELEQTIAGYERRIARGNLSKEELAIQRDFLKGIKIDLSRRKEQYKRASQVLNVGRIDGLKNG